MNRIVLRKIHAIAGAAAFLLITTFWTSTVISELFGSQATVVAVKHVIVYALFALMFCMARGDGHEDGRQEQPPTHRRQAPPHAVYRR